MSIAKSNAELFSTGSKMAGMAPESASLRRLTPVKPEWRLQGFYGKSRVLTSFGRMPIEALRKRDRLKTASGAFLEVKWIDELKLEVEFLEFHPEAHPIYIPKNALANGHPDANVLVSPAQKLKEPARAGQGRLIRASNLVGRTNAARMPHSGFTYYRFHVGVPAEVSVDGLWFHVWP